MKRERGIHGNEDAEFTERNTALSRNAVFFPRVPRSLFILVFAGAYALFLMAASGRGQAPPPTARRWNPTRVPAGVKFSGDTACAECHRERVAVQRQTAMGQAMESVIDSTILKSHPQMKLRLGKYSYEITRQGSQSFFNVTDGAETISAPIEYAFGQGKAGQTYLFQRDGAWYESRVSFYNDIRGLDLTIGAPGTPPKSLDEALGRRLSRDDALRCFACHSTGGVSGGRIHTEQLTLGVRCESCHGPGGDHIAANKAEQPDAARLIFNPARLSGDELTQDFCASCHRGSEEFSLLKTMGVSNVRFQPYRIFTSKCYSDDKRISCTACHNPHEPLKVDAAYYDAKCLGCHSTTERAESATKADARGCRVGTKDCASCHMPKIEPPGAHFKFTDHLIRVVRPNQPYPN